MSENFSDGVKAVLDEAIQRMFELSCYVTDYGHTHTKALRSGITEIKEALELVKEQREALQYIRNELGVPTDDYPISVVNASQRAWEALQEPEP